MQEFDLPSIFPSEILPSLENYLQNPKASSSSDMQLSLALRNFDTRDEQLVILSEIKEGELFQTRNGRLFLKGPQQRKRFRCKEVKTGRLYLFNPISEVKLA